MAGEGLNPKEGDPSAGGGLPSTTAPQLGAAPPPIPGEVVADRSVPLDPWTPEAPDEASVVHPVNVQGLTDPWGILESCAIGLLRPQMTSSLSSAPGRRSQLREPVVGVAGVGLSAILGSPPSGDAHERSEIGREIEARRLAWAAVTGSRRRWLQHPRMKTRWTTVREIEESRSIWSTLNFGR